MFHHPILGIFRVEGGSMVPRLHDGDYVISTKLLSLKPGRLVVVNHPDYQRMVKRVLAVKEGRFLLIGENAGSVSTEQMGWCELDQVVGVVIKAIKQSAESMVLKDGTDGI